MKLLNNLVVAFSMYSKIPMPRADWTKENMKYALCFFPWIGLVIGAIEVGWYVLTKTLGIGSLFRAAGMVLIPVLVTGGIHLDGLLDTADALSSWREKERRLEILKDSHAGAFAVIVCVCYFTAAVGAASEVNERMLRVLPFLFAVSRCWSGLSVVNFRNANPKGTAAMFGSQAEKRRVNLVLALTLLVLTVLCICLMPLYGLLLTAAGALTFLYYRSMSERYFGGITGDLAGFFLCLCELMMLLAVLFGDKIMGVIVG